MLKATGYISTPLRLVAAGFIILVIAAYGYWHWVYSSPSHVFNRMLGTMLATPGVSKHVVQNDNSQQLDQETQAVTAPTQRVHSFSTLRQGENGSTAVITESLASPSVDFVRYTNIKTDQKTTDGKGFNFSSILDIWGKADNNDQESGGAQLFSQTVLGVVPSANLNAAARKALVKQEVDNQVYKIDYGKIKRQVVAGRPQYSYDVTVQPVAYVTTLKSFARSIGLTQLEQVDPSQYEGSEALKFTLVVDVWSGELVKVMYTGSDRTETYGAYGVRAQIDLPKNSIPVTELQTRLQQIH